MQLQWNGILFVFSPALFLYKETWHVLHRCHFLQRLSFRRQKWLTSVESGLTLILHSVHRSIRSQARGFYLILFSKGLHGMHFVRPLQSVTTNGPKWQLCNRFNQLVWFPLFGWLEAICSPLIFSFSERKKPQSQSNGVSFFSRK